MKSSAQLERRRFERAPIIAQVEYELTNSSSGPSRVRKNMANISTGGLFITTEEPIRAGTRMVVRFELPNKHRVIAVSRVCYAKKGIGLGVEFLKLEDEDREEIETYIGSMK
jgi:c-di-GMP-binding flagellar brake protein YcgR